MPKKTPLQQVNDEHGGKQKLADKLVDMLNRGDEDKAEFRSRLLAAPNSKLLRLYRVSTTIKERFGSKDKLVDALLALANRNGDKDYRARLAQWSPARLLSRFEQQRKKASRVQRRAAS